MKKLRQLSSEDNTSLKNLMKQDIYSKMEGIEVMNLYKYFDQFHENGWMNPVKKINVRLEEDQICQINKECIQAKENIKQQLHQLENQKKKQIDERMELLSHYGRLINKIKEDKQRSERQFSNDYLILKDEANICDLPFEEGLQVAIKHMEKITERSKNKKCTSLWHQIDKTYFIVREIKKKYANLFNTLKGKVRNVIENRQLDWIFKDIDSLNEIEVDSKVLRETLLNILNYLWEEYIIRSKKKASEFETLFNQIFTIKEKYEKQVKGYKAFETAIVDYVNKIQQTMKTSAQLLQKFRQRFIFIEETKNKLVFYEHDFINTETRKLLQEKEKQAYLKQRYKKATEIKIDEKSLHCSLRTIFFFTDVQSTASFFLKTANQLEKVTSQEIAKVVIIYLSYQNYPNFKKNFDPQMLKKISLTCQDLKTRFRNCFDSPQNLSLLTCLLEMFKCRLVSDQPNMSIFKYFILVNKESPLLKLFKEKQKTFGYFMDQKRETLLMKVSNILQELERQTKVGLPWSADQSFEAVPWLSANYDKMMPDKKSQLIQKVQHRRVRLFEFMGDNQFISHQSSLFVYHQLKCYRDLLCLILEGEMNLSLQKMIVRDMQELEDEWESWVPYATKFQFVFKRM